MPRPSGSPRRGRPSKFGRPSRVVALTLPEEIIRGLRRLNPDLAWAIVTLFEGDPRLAAAAAAFPDSELVRIADRRSLIAINRRTFSKLPGVNFIPLDESRAFLALDAGHGMSDLELAVIDRLDDQAVDAAERKALAELRSRLRRWRHDRALRFHTRAIIVVEHVRGGRRRE